MQWLALVVTGEKCVHVLYININIRNLMVLNRCIHDTLLSATKVNHHLVFSAYFTNIDQPLIPGYGTRTPECMVTQKYCDQHILVC